MFRADLIMPADVDFTIDHVLLKIKEPKTPYRSARRQSGKLEPADLVYVVSVGFGGLPRSERLWCSFRSHSEDTIRKVTFPANSPQSKPKDDDVSFFQTRRRYMVDWQNRICESCEAEGSLGLFQDDGDLFARGECSYLSQ